MPTVLRRIRAVLRSLRAVPAAVSNAMPRRLVDGVLVAAAFALVASQIADRAEDPARTVALVVLGVVLAGLGFWKVPQWQAETAHRREPKRSRFDLENEARKTLAQALGGLFLVVGLAVTWLQLDAARDEQQLSREQAEDARALTRQGQLTERFTAAVDQLGSDKMQVRIGALHALDHLAQDSPDHVPAVLEVMAAFVRERATWPIPPGTPTPVPDAGGRYAPPADVQETLLLMGRGLWLVPQRDADAGPPRDPTPTPDPELRELGCLNLNRTDLRGARLVGGFPIPLCPGDADLTGADIGVADLTGAYLYQADLTDVYLFLVDLTDAFLVGADLAGANLREADLVGANMVSADLTGADLTGADLTGADLSTAVGLTQPQIDSATYDIFEPPQFPPGLRP